MPRSPLQKRSEQNHPPAAPLSSKSCQANSLSLRVPFKGDHCSPLHPSGTHLGARGKASPLARPAPVCIQSSVRRKPPLARKDSARPFAWPGAECDKKGKATRSIARGHASPAGGGAPMPLSTASFPCKAGGEERSGRRELLALPVRLSRRLTARLRLARLPEKGSPPPEPFAGSWTHFRSPGYCLHQLHAPYRSPAALTLSPPKPLSENTTGGNISIRSHCQILETTISEYPLLLNYIKNSTQAGPHVETDIEFDPALCQWKAVTITDLHGFSRPPLIPSGFEEMAAGGRESKVDLQSLYLIQTLMAINTLLL
ncbi:uncharacterized protein LOC143835599 isoform X2 [Paroedura picta]|uniref:uncharacterized protein LOC143835599 isoform X2 n=1 Tax=Paroedura picta TaxID=143630 RepID=UPI0040570240